MAKIDKEFFKKLIEKLKVPALFAVIVYLATLTGMLSPIGDGAYLHIGDAAVYITALVLPFPYAAAASALGALFADITLGSTMYIIPTVIIKVLLVLAVKFVLRLTDKPATQDLFVCLTGVITVVGYYVAEVVLDMLSGTAFIPALSSAAADSIIYNILQALACAVVYMILSGIVRSVMDKRKAKELN